MDAKKKKDLVKIFFDLDIEDQIEVAEELELSGYPGIDLRSFQNYINKIDHNASELHITRLALTSDQKDTLKRLAGE